MAIDKNNIEKYIFDPNNPRQCKSYNLLLNLAKKDNSLLVSRDFIINFFLSDSFFMKLKDELWDIP